MHNNKNAKGRTTVLYLLSSFFALIGLFGAGYLISKTPDNFIYISALCACALVVVLIIAAIIVNSAYRKRSIDGPQSETLFAIMYNEIRNLEEPAFICDPHGKIVWYNPYMQTSTGQKSPILGSYISNFFDGELLEDDFIPEIDFCDKKYRIERNGVKADDKSYFLFVLRDITKETELAKELKDTDKLIAYIAVDNIEELLQFEQDKYRNASAEIDELVRNWAASVNGVIKEYEKNKYIFIFEAQHLEEFFTETLNTLDEKGSDTESASLGFNILKQARDIRIGAAGIPVTLSIGIANISGTFEERDKASQECLKTALERGGDQALVKYVENGEIKEKTFGARTNAAQRRGRVRARVIANELVSHIVTASNVLIMAHARPDYDAIGASVGISKFCQLCGVKYNIVTDFKNTNVEKSLKYLDGVDEYYGKFIDKHEALDLVSDNTLLVLVDVNSPKQLESKDLAENIEKHIIIDHHRKGDDFIKEPIISYIETSASSASEIVTEMLEQTIRDENVLPCEAKLLFAGITLDTKQFTKNTGTKTYGASMYLRERGASYDDIADLFKSTLDDFLQEVSFGEHVELYGDNMAIAVKESGAGKGAEITAAKVADNLLTISGVEASFVVTKFDNMVKISARSNGNINVQIILNEIGGGGHFNSAAGTFVGESVKDVVKKLKEAIDKYKL